MYAKMNAGEPISGKIIIFPIAVVNPVIDKIIILPINNQVIAITEQHLTINFHYHHNY